MELRHLKHFLAVCDTGSYVRAAESVGVSQSTITKSVAKLERESGVRLFERGRFGAAVTTYGASLARRARAICAEERLATAELDSMKGGAEGHVNVGMGLSFAFRLMPEAIRRFRAKRPNVGVSCFQGTSSDLFPLLRAGQLDFAVTSPEVGFQVDADLVAEPLLEDNEFLVVGTHHPLAAIRRRPVRADDLAQYPFSASRSVSYVIQHVTAFFERHDLPPPAFSVRTDSAILAKALLRTDQFIGVMGHELFEHEARLGLLKALNVPDFILRRRALLTRRRRSCDRRPWSFDVRSIPFSNRFCRVSDCLSRVEEPTVPPHDPYT